MFININFLKQIIAFYKQIYHYCTTSFLMNTSKNMLSSSQISTLNKLTTQTNSAKITRDFDNQFTQESALQIDCYLMRHAQSKYNQIMHLYPFQQASQQAKDRYQMDCSLIDCQITKKGRIQIQNIQFPSNLRVQNSIYFDIIFISPLNRSLETAKSVLQYHGIRCGRKIVIKQLTQVISKICDFGDGMQKKIQKYGQIFDFSDGKNQQKVQNQMTRSNLDIFEQKNSENFQGGLQLNENANINNFWQDSFIDQNLKHQINYEKQNGKRYLQILDKIFPNPLQSVQNCLKRSLMALQKIKQISYSLKATKILVISHNRILKNILTKGQKDKLQIFNIMKNCQIRNIKL